MSLGLVKQVKEEIIVLPFKNLEFSEIARDVSTFFNEKCANNDVNPTREVSSYVLNIATAFLDQDLFLEGVSSADQGAARQVYIKASKIYSRNPRVSGVYEERSGDGFSMPSNGSYLDKVNAYLHNLADIALTGDKLNSREMRFSQGLFWEAHKLMSPVNKS